MTGDRLHSFKDRRVVEEFLEMMGYNSVLVWVIPGLSQHLDLVIVCVAVQQKFS